MDSYACTQLLTAIKLLCLEVRVQALQELMQHWQQLAGPLQQAAAVGHEHTLRRIEIRCRLCVCVKWSAGWEQAVSTWFGCVCAVTGS